MEKVGIITIPDYNNYGNRLQNYAVKRVFEKLGYQVYTLEMNDSAFIKYRQRKYKLLLKKYKVYPLVFGFEMIQGGVAKARRERLFEKFSRKYLNVRYEPTYNEILVEELLEEFKYFVLGSDQIWHPYINDTPNLYFAKFAPKRKKLFFAPSFGVEELPDEYKKIVIEGLRDAENISVREPEGAKIIGQLLGKSSTVLMDPTLMLDADEWRAIAIKPYDFVEEEYVLKCFLGPINQEYSKAIKNIIDETGLALYALADKKIISGYVTGPSEFVYSIMNSKLVLTDSFHAVVFAILFNKPFVVFSRLNENGENAGLDSRVDELLRKLKLDCRKYNANFNVSLYECDFSQVKTILKEERRKVNRFLRKSTM